MKTERPRPSVKSLRYGYTTNIMRKFASLYVCHRNKWTDFDEAIIIPVQSERQVDEQFKITKPYFRSFLLFIKMIIM